MVFPERIRPNWALSVGSSAARLLKVTRLSQCVRLTVCDCLAVCIGVCLTVYVSVCMSHCVYFTVYASLCVSHCMSEGEPDEKQRNRLLTAACSSTFVKRLLRNDANVVAVDGAMRKQSFQSSARAQAKNPVFKDGFFAQIKETYARHYAEGILRTPEPENDQMFGGDEVGTNPAGGKHGRRVFCSMLRTQITKVTQGEGGKAVYWVTFFYWSRFDGQFTIPPCVVHEGGEMCELFARNLPSDWCVHSSPSGYMDRDGWFKVACHFQKHCGPTRPLYLFFDGHDSHWDPDALQLWFDDKIFSFFGRAHGSDDDNVNDNGCNAKFHAIFESVTGDWQESYPPMIRDNAGFYNMRIVPVWRRLKAEGGLVTVKAAAMCGLYPFNPDAENYNNGLDLLARKWTVETPWRDGDFHPDWQECKEGPKYTLMQARQKAPDRSILVRAKAAEYFETSTIVPCKEITQMLQDQKRARKNKVPTGPNRQNPNTTYGLAVTQGVINEAKVTQGNKDIVAAGAIASKLSAETKRVERRQLKSSTFELVLHTICAKDFDWAKVSGRGGAFKAENVSLTLQAWMDDAKYTKGKKVNDNVLNLQHKFKRMRVALILSMQARRATPRLYGITFNGKIL